MGANRRGFGFGVWGLGTARSAQPAPVGRSFFSARSKPQTPNPKPYFRLGLPLCLTALLAFSGCAERVGRPTAATVPEPVRIVPTPPKVVDGSLWQESQRAEASIVSDQKARAQGDIVTIVVVEKINAQRSSSTTTARSQNVDASASELFFPGFGSISTTALAAYALGTPKAGRTGTVTPQTMPAVKLGSKRDFAGSGSIQNSNTVTATLAAQVVEVMPNGNLILMASKEVAVSGEVQVVTLTGIVREKDITPDNQIASTNLAEARIHISGAGPLNDAQKRTLITRFFDFVNLF